MFLVYRPARNGVGTFAQHRVVHESFALPIIFTIEAIPPLIHKECPVPHTTSQDGIAGASNDAVNQDMNLVRVAIEAYLLPELVLKPATQVVNSNDALLIRFCHLFGCGKRL